MSTFLAEVMGTCILIVLGCGINAGNSLSLSYSKGSGWSFICFGWGLSVTLAVYAVGNYSGAHLNPAVTLGLFLSGDSNLSVLDLPIYMGAQMIGAILGAAIVWAHYLPHWAKTEDPGTKLGVFSTGPAIPSFWSNLLSETLGTMVLLLGLLFIGANQFTEGLNPIVVGILIAVIGMAQGGTTGFAINPARDLGPRIAHSILPIAGKGDSNWGYAPIPVIGPLVGGAIGALFYQGLFVGKLDILFFVGLAVLIGLIIMAYQEQRGKESIVH